MPRPEQRSLPAEPHPTDTAVGRVGIKKPTQKKPKKNHLKKPTKNVFFLGFLNF
jgi:hypothetical protein